MRRWLVGTAVAILLLCGAFAVAVAFNPDLILVGLTLFDDHPMREGPLAREIYGCSEKTDPPCVNDNGGMKDISGALRRHIPVGTKQEAATEALRRARLTCSSSGAQASCARELAIFPCGHHWLATFATAGDGTVTTLSGKWGWTCL
jgi:hypothetical protein